MLRGMTERGMPAASGREATMSTGPLGSTLHVLRADAATIAELAAIDWTSRFRRVRLDPHGGLVTLMAPSRLHDELATIFGNLVDIAGSMLSGAVKALATARLREPGAPPGTGMEPDCAFYFGENARAYREALARGREAADAFFEKTAPDLVVEVELTNADRDKIDRYASLGVRELWLLRHRGGDELPEAEFLALRPGASPRPLAASNVLGGLVPTDVREALTGLRLSVTRAEQAETVTAVVRRRQRASVRVQEETAPYVPAAGAGAATPPPERPPAAGAGSGRPRDRRRTSSPCSASGRRHARTGPRSGPR